MIENPAEARGTGGLIGAYGVLVADHGQVSLSRLGPNGDLASASSLPVDLGPDFAALYGNDPALWGNASLSPYCAALTSTQSLGSSERIISPTYRAADRITVRAMASVSPVGR